MMSQSNNINNDKGFFKEKNRIGGVIKNEGFMSLEVIARGYKVESKWALQRWLSEPTTLEYIQLWERLHNPDFDNNKFISVCDTALSVGSFPSLEELILDCRAKSIYVDLSLHKDVYIHRDIACDFACWLSPAFRVYCLHNLSLSAGSKSLTFASEEDFIVSKTTVAQAVKKDALKKYISEVRLCNFATNEHPEYNYIIKGKLNITNK